MNEALNCLEICYRQESQHHHQFYSYRENRAGAMGQILCWISATIIEMEAKNPRGPELDAEAPGPHILELGTLEPVLRTQSQRSLAELEG